MREEVLKKFYINNSKEVPLVAGLEMQFTSWLHLIKNILHLNA